jgi:hypothetical protein
MHLSVSTLLDARPERVWEAVTTPALLGHVAAPLLRFDPVEPSAVPDRWSAEDSLV